MPKILIPTPLRPYTDKQDAVDASGATVGELLADLTRKHSGLKAHLYNEQGKLRSFVNVYVNDEDIRYLDKDATKLAGNETIAIVPSIAGGAVGVVEPQTAVLSNEEVARYSRHLMLPEVGMDGKIKVKQ